jgi:hypothetical protein
LVGLTGDAAMLEPPAKRQKRQVRLESAHACDNIAD